MMPLAFPKIILVFSVYLRDSVSLWQILRKRMAMIKLTQMVKAAG